MSMQENVFLDYGFVITSDICAYLTGFFARNDKDFLDTGTRKTALRPDFFDLVKGTSLDELGDDFYDRDKILEQLQNDNADVVYCNHFDGEVSTIAEMISGKRLAPLEIECYDEFLLMIPLSRAPELFKQAYRDAEEVMQEILEKLQPYKAAFPDGFDFSRYICEAKGIVTLT